MEIFRDKMNQYIAFDQHSLACNYFLGVMKGLNDISDYCNNIGDPDCVLDDLTTITEDFFDMYHSKLTPKNKLKAKAFFETYHLDWEERL
jgi:hypothetical protein